MLRRGILSIVVSVSIGAVLAPGASAAGPIPLSLNQGAAFAILGHSCGGIQEKVYATGFSSSNGYPTGEVSMSTTCGGSGKGGGGHSTTYTGSATVVWTWFGETRNFAALTGTASGSESFSETDSHGDHLYNVRANAYLETGTAPPFQPPAAPEGVGAYVSLYEPSENVEYLRMSVSWSAAPETAGLITSFTVTATPVGGSAAPVLSATARGNWPIAYLSPVQPNTTYSVTVTSTDEEGTSSESAPVTLTSPNEDGEAPKEQKKVQTCTSNYGTIALSPGLTETPHVQKITLTGELRGCEGPLEFESGSYVDHLKTTSAVTCSVLSNPSLAPETVAGKLAVSWLPSGEGASSKGSMVLPLSEAALTGLTGTLEGGPFGTPTSVSAASVSESFASGCGIAVGKKKAKPIKNGSFSTSEVEF